MAIEIRLEGRLGTAPDEISSEWFHRQMITARGGDATLLVNSPGGDFFTGTTIYNELRRHVGTTTALVQGMAASAASLAIMGCDRIIMGAGALLMLHRSSGLTVGSQADHADMAELLATIDRQMAGIYANRTGLPSARIEEMMEAETWLTGEEALALGFCDSVWQAAPKKQAAALVAQAAAMGTRYQFRNMIAAISALDRGAAIAEAVKMHPQSAKMTTKTESGVNDDVAS